MFDVIVYSTRTCQACIATKRRLIDLGVDFRVIDLDDMSKTWLIDELKRAGYTHLPVVIVKSDAITVTSSWDGYRPDSINALA
jgi:glutaredoxin-like protein NrdH